MVKPPKRIAVPDPQKLFVSCESFRHASASLLRDSNEGKTIYFYAYIANDAFCCELFLKCVDAARTGSHLKGHKLIELFEALGPADQDAVERHYDAQSRGTKNHMPLRELLTVSASLFEMVRYWHEEKVTDSRMNLIYPITALRQRVLEIHPHWAPLRRR